MIHDTALVSEKAEIGKNVKVGAFAIIDEGVVVGDECEIAPKVHLKKGTVLGRGNYIGEGTLIGDKPQDTKFKDEESFVIVGDGNVIREYATIHRATAPGGATRIGDNNFIMGYVHMAHDARVKNNVIIVNAAQLAGHTLVEDHAFISSTVLVHQGVRIGAYSMIGGGCRVTKDAMPFVMVVSEPARTFGLNKVGLKRKGFDSARIKALQNAYNIIFRKKLMMKEAVETVKKQAENTEDVRHFIEFAETSARGIIR
ncbi:MAG: acyl-ACP--UDP-N-acetylglucosamine O-acyltransferase [Candidatus Goldiibacteriota bacterium]